MEDIRMEIGEEQEKNITKMVHIKNVAIENQLYVALEVVIEGFLLDQHFYGDKTKQFKYFIQ